MFSTFQSLKYPFCWTVCVFCFLLFGLGKPFIHKIVWRQKKCFCHICILLFLIRIISEIYLRYIPYLPGKVKIQILFHMKTYYQCTYPFCFISCPLNRDIWFHSAILDLHFEDEIHLNFKKLCVSTISKLKMHVNNFYIFEDEIVSFS